MLVRCVCVCVCVCVLVVLGWLCYGVVVDVVIWRSTMSV